jgi:hypothetical protein
MGLALDIIAGIFTGGIYNAAKGAKGGYDKSNDSSTVTYGESVDYSEAMRYASDNNKTTALAQIQGQEFALQQAALDREMQLAANVELGIEKLDTKLQISKLDYFQQMTAEENKHVETMAQIKNGGTGAGIESDIPEPTPASSASEITDSRESPSPSW